MVGVLIANEAIEPRAVTRRHLQVERARFFADDRQSRRTDLGRVGQIRDDYVLIAERKAVESISARGIRSRFGARIDRAESSRDPRIDDGSGAFDERDPSTEPAFRYFGLSRRMTVASEKDTREEQEPFHAPDTTHLRKASTSMRVRVLVFGMLMSVRVSRHS